MKRKIVHLLVITAGGSYTSLCGVRHAPISADDKRKVTCMRCRSIMRRGASGGI